MDLLSTDSNRAHLDRSIVGIRESWMRCQERYNLDRAARPYIPALSTREVGEHCEPFDENLSAIKDELEFVRTTLRSANFCASFSNMAGIILRLDANADLDRELELERPGTIWAEGVAGTNGVGTCVVERRPAMVLGKNHYFSAFSPLSCIAAPVLSADAEMVGVLNVATSAPHVTIETFALIGGLAITSAERLSNHFFTHRFRCDPVLKIQRDGRLLLIALDGDQRLIGANRNAREYYKLSLGGDRKTDLWSIFERNPDVVDGLAREGDVRGLRRLDSADVCNAQVLRGEKGHAGSRLARRLPPAQIPRQMIATGDPTVEQCLGSHPRMATVSRLLRRVAGALPVLLLGETGVGKDTLARALHNEGLRRERPFVAFNCAAVPESLIDSELFGYGAGAFTGAKRDGHAGRLTQADGGTLFLDEIGDMPLALQTRLLRVLETGEVNPLGSGRVQHIDVNVIAATNCDLLNSVREGRFRQDLYHRLAGVVVEMQPLRERVDIEEIARRLLGSDKCVPSVELGDEAINALRDYTWPGNIRELKFVLQRASHICEDYVIAPQDLLLPAGPRPDRSLPAPDAAPAPGQALLAAEKQVIADALSEHAGDIARTAQALEMSRATLYRKMRLHNLGRKKPVLAN